MINCHFHPRPALEANLAHLNGSGCQAAYLLARLTAEDDIRRFTAQEPARFAGYSVSTDNRHIKLCRRRVQAPQRGA